MREIRLYGSEGGGAVCSPYPYHSHPKRDKAIALQKVMGEPSTRGLNRFERQLELRLFSA